ncbi:MAG TPA: fibronectin type III domain-containing protein [Flavipsychrobacter sp.]|nr:fibronectin type III domain-containing protein [Flavipsychrobacter sp.]
MATIALKLDKRNVPDLIQFSSNIHTKMTANSTIFAAPPVTMADFLSAIDELGAAQQATIGGGTSATMVRNEKLATVRMLLLSLAGYVTSISRGDANIIDLAGMPVKTRGPRRYDTLNVPQDLRAFVLRHGVIGLKWTKVHNAKAYAIEFCPDPLTGTEWKSGMCNSGCNGSVSDLMPGKVYWFRVRALGSQGLTSDWTEPICLMAM